MFSVMGLGMQTEQSCCGAFTVAVGIIGLMTAKEGQTDVSNMEGYQMIAELTDFMLGFYGTLHCVELQRLEIMGCENPCHAIVEALARKLRSCWRAAGPSARLMRDRVVRDMLERRSHERLCQYGKRRDDEWEILPWIPDPRPPFKIWVKPEQISAILSHSPPPLCALPSAENQRWIPDGRIPSAGTDWKQRRLGAVGPGRDTGVRGKQQRCGSVSLRL